MILTSQVPEHGPGPSLTISELPEVADRPSHKLAAELAFTVIGLPRNRIAVSIHIYSPSSSQMLSVGGMYVVVTLVLVKILYHR